MARHDVPGGRDQGHAAMILQSPHASGQRGLTLIETLVAFAIIAGVVTSVLALVAQNARYLAASDERLLGAMLANNQMVELFADNVPADIGETTDQMDFGGRRFLVRRQVIELQDGVVQAIIEASAPDTGQVLARVAALKGTAQ